MSNVATAPSAKSSTSVSLTDFPSNQNVIQPYAGTGNVSLYLSGPGTLYVYFSGGGDSNVRYGQNFGFPGTPLPTGVSTFPLSPGFNMQWSSTTGGFKLVWATG